MLKQLVESIENNEFGDIRSILDEVYPLPTFEQYTILAALLTSVQGAEFMHDIDQGWYYSEAK